MQLSLSKSAPIIGSFMKIHITVSAHSAQARQQIGLNLSRIKATLHNDHFLQSAFFRLPLLSTTCPFLDFSAFFRLFRSASFCYFLLLSTFLLPSTFYCLLFSGTFCLNAAFYRLLLFAVFRLGGLCLLPPTAFCFLEPSVLFNITMRVQTSKFESATN